MSAPASRPTLGRPGLLAVAAIALATLAFEVLLTRILSATVWYHFAFMAVSVAMFGLTAGALAVHFRAAAFDRDVRGAMVRASLATALTMPPALLLHLAVPIVEEATAAALFGVLLTFVAFAVPCFFSGIAICLALTRFPEQVGRIYAADLAGAAAGAVLVVLLLAVVDGPGAVLATAAIAALASLAFALDAPGEGRRAARLPAVAALGIVALRGRLPTCVVRIRSVLSLIEQSGAATAAEAAPIVAQGLATRAPVRSG